jgi:hypothetical protein
MPRLQSTTFGVLALVALLAGCKPPTSGSSNHDDGTADDETESIPASCDPAALRCVANTPQRCNDEGTAWVEQAACGGATPVCAEGSGCTPCVAGQRTCEGSQPLVCSDSGSGFVSAGAPCDGDAGESCQHGVCVNACSASSIGNSYVGCEYVAVDLPNCQQSGTLSPSDAQFAVVVSNGDQALTARVRVFTGDDDSQPLLTADVAPNDLAVLAINPAVPPARSNVQGSGVHLGRAFHIVSNLPVTAYQFNPLNNTEAAFSNDASLLLPLNSLGSEYIVATGDGVVGGDDTNGDGVAEEMMPWGAFVTIVAIEDGTEVTVTPTWEVQPGAGVGGGEAPVTVTLDRFDVLNLESQTVDGEDTPAGTANLSGTGVRATRPVAVFSGNVATVVPQPEASCCADHLEEQIIPLAAWGQRFVVARGMGRRAPGDWEPEYYRITGGNPPAGQDVIHLTYAPSAPEGAPTELHEGESVQFPSTTDYIVDADGPLLVTSFFVSSYYSAPEINLSNPFSMHTCFTQAECTGLPYAAVCVTGAFGGTCEPVGDPSMTVIPPVEQFRSSYVFLTPLDYEFDAITVIVPMGTSLILDGAPLEAATPIGELAGTSYGAVRTLVADGTHRLSTEGGEEVGLIVLGMDKDVSYGYPAGLDLEAINPLE